MARTEKTGRFFGKDLQAWAFLAPAGAILILFWVLPLVLSVFVAFTNWHGGDTAADARWVGLENFRMAMRDPRFFKSLWNTVNYVVWSVPLTIAVSLALALLLNRKVRGLGVFRTAFFLPYVTTWVAISIVWTYFFQQNFGLANYVLDDVLGFGSLRWLNEPRGVVEMSLTGLGHLARVLPPAEMLDFKNPLVEGPSLAMFSIILTSVWRDTGYFTVIFLAGLQSIDRTYYEAAEIDGAGPWRRFRTITWPLLSPVTFFVLIIAMIGAFKVFVPMLVMTPEGGPSGSTTTLVYFLYEEGFLSWRLGYASAIAYILFLIILAMTLLQNRLFGRRVFYQ
ncbi:sugar ABC transporter permease [Candidatus Sumerlaeota bacterium]|nr:sugar ABC transporter permease [Candidatus Sumerlaeota bacterium]